MQPAAEGGLIRRPDGEAVGICLELSVCESSHISADPRKQSTDRQKMIAQADISIEDCYKTSKEKHDKRGSRRMQKNPSNDTHRKPRTKRSICWSSAEQNKRTLSKREAERQTRCGNKRSVCSICPASISNIKAVSISMPLSLCIRGPLRGTQLHGRSAVRRYTCEQDRSVCPVNVIRRPSGS